MDTTPLQLLDDAPTGVFRIAASPVIDDRTPHPRLLRRGFARGTRDWNRPR
jgi:hypothetical protein